MSGTVLELTRADVWRTVLEQLPTGVYLLDGGQKIIFWNAGAERITGRLGQDVVGRMTRDQLISRGEPGVAPEPAEESPVRLALRDGRGSKADVFIHHKDGHRVPISLHTFPVRDANGHVIGAAESFEENVASTEWDRRKSKLESYGCLDEATGVLTRDFTESHVRESLTRFSTHPVPFAIVCIHADQLEQIRSKYGPRAAQDILKVVGQTLEHSLRPNDIVGHWEVDEFLVLLAECSRSEIEKVGERLKKMVSYSEIKWWGDAIRISVSLGGTTVFHGDTLEALLQRAHQAMSVSINAGGNRVSILEV
jgi:diguanylate cyclase (GGDEF)-like protein/PAS domain S-box-containing protein